MTCGNCWEYGWELQLLYCSKTEIGDLWYYCHKSTDHCGDFVGSFLPSFPMFVVRDLFMENSKLAKNQSKRMRRGTWPVATICKNHFLIGVLFPPTVHPNYQQQVKLIDSHHASTQI